MENVLKTWADAGYDTLCQSSSDGHCYPAHDEDCYSIDANAPILSQRAFEMLDESEQEGWKY